MFQKNWSVRPHNIEPIHLLRLYSAIREEPWNLCFIITLYTIDAVTYISDIRKEWHDFNVSNQICLKYCFNFCSSYNYEIFYLLIFVWNTFQCKFYIYMSPEWPYFKCTTAKAGCDYSAGTWRQSHQKACPLCSCSWFSWSHTYF